MKPEYLNRLALSCAFIFSAAAVSYVDRATTPPTYETITKTSDVATNDSLLDARDNRVRVNAYQRIASMNTVPFEPSAIPEQRSAA